MFLRELPDAALWYESFSGSFHSHSRPFASSGSFVVGQDDRGKGHGWSLRGQFAARAPAALVIVDAIESVICIAELTVKMFLRELPDAALWYESFSGSFHSHSLPFGRLRVVRGRSG